MFSNVTTLDLSIRRRSLFAYAIGTALYTFAIVALYPEFKNTTSLNNLTKGGSAATALFGVTGSLTSPGGWLNANIYENVFPLIMLLLTIGYGAAAIAGQDEDGTLCLLAVLPLRRTALLLQKAAAMAVQAFVLAFAAGIIVIIGRSFDLALNPWHVIGISATTFLMGIDFGIIALAISAVTGRHGVTIGISSALAAASYLLSSLAPVVGWVRPGRYFSLFYWSVGHDQIANGVSVADVAVLAFVGAGALCAAALAFRRLDLH